MNPTSSIKISNSSAALISSPSTTNRKRKQSQDNTEREQRTNTVGTQVTTSSSSLHSSVTPSLSSRQLSAVSSSSSSSLFTFPPSFSSPSSLELFASRSSTTSSAAPASILQPIQSAPNHVLKTVSLSEALLDLYDAINSNDLARIANCLKKHERYIHLFDSTPLLRAVTLGNLAIVELLLAHKIPIASTDWDGTPHQSVMLLACGNGKLEIIKALLKAGGRLTHECIMAIPIEEDNYDADDQYSLQLLQLILDYIPYDTLTDEQLQLFCEMVNQDGNLRCTEALYARIKQNEACLASFTRSLQSSCYILDSAERARLDQMKFWNKLGQPWNLQDNEDKTALWYVSGYEDEDYDAAAVVKHLLDQPSCATAEYINRCDTATKKTALMNAIESRNFDIVELLLNAGANSYAKDIDGNDAWALAHKLNYEPHQIKVLELLFNQKKRLYALTLPRFGPTFVYPLDADERQAQPVVEQPHQSRSCLDDTKKD